MAGAVSLEVGAESVASEGKPRYRWNVLALAAGLCDFPV